MKQPTRLVFTLAYLVILLALARFINGEWFVLPTGDANLWFQAGLLMVVLGSFFIEQHFTKPVDVVTNVAAGMITLLSLEHRETFLYWGVLLSAMILIGLAAFASMAIQTSLKSNTALKIASVLFSISTFIGSAKRLFSVILFLAVLSYFEIPSLSALLVFAFWALVITSEPLGLTGLVDRLFDAWKNPSTHIGRVWHVMGENIFQIELTSDVKIQEDDVLEISHGDEKIYASVLNDFVLSDKRIINAHGFLRKLSDTNELTRINGAGQVKLLRGEALPARISASPAYAKRHELLGFVDDNTDIATLRFKYLSKVPLKEGYLVKVIVDDQAIVYQIINGVTRSDALQGDRDRYICAIAQQVGAWNGANCRFDAVSWVAEPGSPVYIETSTEIPTLNIAESRSVVGKLPNSEYPIHIDINDIVTHHTAVLGITGSGKTFLAYELIRKMVKSKIKVLVFDVSADYRTHLADLSPLQISSSGDVTKFLEDPGHLLGIAEFAPTAQTTLVRATAASVGNVLTWAKQNLTSQLGENPEARVCVVFEEAHSLIPEWNSVSISGDKDEVNKISQAILQGRKYGVGALVITQRTANITKTILNQCNTIFALQSFDQTGLEFLKNYIGEEHASSLSTLLPRHAVLFGKASSSRRPIIVHLTTAAP